MPRMMQQIMVRNRAMKRVLLDTARIAVKIWLARPVMVRHPAMMPATQQATATETQPLPPAARQSKSLAGVSRCSLLNILTAMVTRMAMPADLPMVNLLVDTSHTSTTSGVSR